MKNDEKNFEKKEIEQLDDEMLKDVSGGAGFDEFPRVKDNDYNDNIKERV